MAMSIQQQLVASIVALFVLSPFGCDGALLLGPVDKTYMIGADINIPCRAQSTSTTGILAYTWWYNNTINLPSWLTPCGTAFVGDKCIRGAQIPYTGYFRCTADDVSQTLLLGNQTGLIQIIRAIVFKDRPQPRIVQVGSPTTFQCSVDTALGSAATIEWLYRPLSNIPTRVALTTEITQTGNDLHFTNVQDTLLGTYYCVARNAAGTVNASATLSAFGAGSPTVNLLSTPVVEKTIGNSVTFQCSVSGRPAIFIVTWYKDDTVIQHSPPHLQIEADNSLKIVTLTKGDAGMYKCSARNTLGTGSSSSVRLQVDEPTDPGNGDSGSSSGLSDSERTIVIAVCAGGGGVLLLAIVAILLLRKPIQHGSGVVRRSVRPLETPDVPPVGFTSNTTGMYPGRPSSRISKKEHRSSLEHRMSRNYSDTALMIGKGAPEGDITDLTGGS
eukprot:scpid63577/ scgid11726/ Basement membrane-specific heparan sulfate proteoglycan core protein; Perlecan; Endorepellin; LG3 peptide